MCCSIEGNVVSQFSCTITESLICLFVFLGRVFDLALGNLVAVVPSVCLCVPVGSLGFILISVCLHWLRGPVFSGIS